MWLKGRCNRNRISYIENVDGVPFHGDNVGIQFVNHFKNVLGQSSNVIPFYDPDRLFVKKLPVFEALNLVRIVSNEEIKLALFDIDGNKASGPDGFSSQFFKDSWSVVGDDVCKAVRDFFSNGKLLKEINSTIISLVPKVAAPSKVSDYRPIAEIDMNPSFRFHWQCKELKLMHLYFANDLLLFCNGDSNSVAVLKNASSIFRGESLSIHITLSFHTHQEMDQQYPTVAKIPILHTGKFEQWQFRIQQYLQHEHYALWEVIEFGDSYEVPTNTTDTTNTTTTTTKSGENGTKSGRTFTLTAEDMQKKKNDVKARTTLLLSLPDEHQLRFSKYKTTRELWAAILKTFGGNEATKKTKKNLLKQQYGNFRAEGSETLEQTFSRLQVIVGQLQFMDVEVEQDDINQKFLTSLASKWLMHTIVWRNKSDLDTMSLDDFSGIEDGNTACVPSASTNVPIASASVATISQDTACAYIASQSSSSQIKFKDINQIDKDDMEEMDIKWNMALLSMRADKFWKRTWKKISIQGSYVAGFDKSKVECFNYHKMGHFARECTAPRSQDRGRRDNFRQGEDHALVADEVAPIEFTLMANTSTESKVFDNSLCLKDCKKNNDSLNSKITDLTDKLFDAKNMIYHYKLALAQVESRLVKYKEREVKYIEKIKTLEFYNEFNKECIKTLKKKLETLKQEKEGVNGKLAGVLTVLKDIDNLIKSQRSDKNKGGLGYTAVPPPPVQLYLTPKKDLSWTGLPKCANDTVTDYSRLSPTVESTSEEDQNRNPSVSEM
nr:RNA-directed DNA polymerase, eukaryota, reverse transcriptase zinc-binding domain protein [Tanacetum cinerariifolium]